jgi:hypothetical protein
MDARRQFLEIGHILGAAQCSQTLGDIFYLQAKYMEASDMLTEAKRQFLEIGNVACATQCSQSLENVLRMQALSLQHPVRSPQ